MLFEHLVPPPGCSSLCSDRVELANGSSMLVWNDTVRDPALRLSKAGLLNLLCGAGNFVKIRSTCGQDGIQYIQWSINKYSIIMYVIFTCVFFLHIKCYKNRLMIMGKIKKRNSQPTLGYRHVSTIFTKLSYIMSVSINKQARKFSKFLRRSISTLPGKEKDVFSFQKIRCMRATDWVGLH